MYTVLMVGVNFNGDNITRLKHCGLVSLGRLMKHGMWDSNFNYCVRKCLLVSYVLRTQFLFGCVDAMDIR